MVQWSGRLPVPAASDADLLAALVWLLPDKVCECAQQSQE
jgi:hypothetical protein